MKRNLITKKIISLILTVVMIGSCWVFAPIEAEAKTSHTYACDFPRAEYKVGNTIVLPADKYFGHNGFGLNGGLCVNGTEFGEHTLNTLFFLNSSFTSMAFCIQLGTSVNKGSEIETSDESEACDALADRLKTSANASKVAMSGHRMKTLLRSILAYGYHHDGSNTNLWRFVDNYGNLTQDAYDFCYAYATQILVWELTAGERNQGFERIDVPTGYTSVYIHALKSNNPLKGIIDSYYRQIENNVKNVSPSVDIHEEFTFELNDYKKELTVSIPDANGLLTHISSISGLEGASIIHTGNSLTITIPYRYAREGKYSFSTTVTRQIPDEINIYLPEHSQDMITAVGNLKNDYETITIDLIIPHHHEWIPHYVIPTCTTEGLTCMMCKCGDIYTQKVEPCLGHNEKSPWVIGYPATCTEAGEEVQICNRCSTVINTRVIPATGHDEGVWIIETEATANHDGQMVLHCTKCGNRTQTDTFPRHEHDGQHTAVVNTATCATEGQLGTFCDTCGVCYKTTTIPAGHSKTQTWVTTLQPTCSRAGESSAYCKDCGDIVATKSLEATGHSDGVWMTSISPYCGLTGEDICICDKCGEIVASRETEALSHDEGVWKITKDPTCEFNGERVKSCTRCGQVIETEAIAALGHDEGVWKIDIEATADIDGSMGRYCTRCSMVLETKGFTLHSHEAGYTITLLQTTCTRDGEKGTVCKICNAVYSAENVPALNHDYSDFYTEDNGTHSKSCSRCHYVYTENCAYEVIESLEATCTTAGYKTSKCTVCAYTYSDSYVAPYGHTLGKWTSEGKSTHMRYCSDCGVMEITKHVWGEYFSNNDGDIIEEGSKTRSCIYCSESQTVGKPASIIESTYKATIEALDFLTRLFNILGEIRDYFIQILEFMKSTK